MLRVIFIVASILLLPLAAEAKYRALSLNDLLAKSDLVVSGTITKVDAKNFQFKLTEIIVGKCDVKSIEVKRFVNWPCASRWTEYKSGQKLLLCLSVKRDSSGKAQSYTIRSAGGEGEMPIVDEQVYVRTHSQVKLRAERKMHSDIYGAKLTATEVPLTDIKRFTRLLRKKRGRAK